MPLGSLLCNRLILGSELVSLHDLATVTSKAIPTLLALLLACMLSFGKNCS